MGWTAPHVLPAPAGLALVHQTLHTQSAECRTLLGTHENV